MYTSDSEILDIAKSLDNEVKRIKHEVYKLSWYMRGGVDSSTLMHDTDLEDLGILSKIVEENIEMSKKAGTPII